MTAAVSEASNSARLSLPDRLYRWRDRLLASPRFQRFAADFPLSRPFAARAEAQLFDILAGFVHAQVLACLVRRGAFAALSDGPLTEAEFAARLSLPAEGAQRLAKAGVALRLLARRSGGRIGLGLTGGALAGSPGVTAMIAHHDALYADLAEIDALLEGAPRRTAMADYWPYAGAAVPGDLSADAVAPYSALMSASQALVAGDILDAYPFGRHRAVLDVGGGEGAFLMALGARHPRLGLALFDLPAVVELARSKAPPGTVITGGSFTADPLPRGADLITLNRIVLDHDDATIARLLAAVYEALPPGGTVLIAEPIAGRVTARVTDAYFGIYLFAMGRGRARSLAEHHALLTNAGFEVVRQRRTRRPRMTGLLTARKKL